LFYLWPFRQLSAFPGRNHRGTTRSMSMCRENLPSRIIVGATTSVRLNSPVGFPFGSDAREGVAIVPPLCRGVTKIFKISQRLSSRSRNAPLQARHRATAVPSAAGALSPGWHSSALQMLSSVSNRTPFTLSDFRNDFFSLI
jgi:hypothetical protein